MTIPRRFGALAGLAAGGLAVALGMLFAAITDVVSPIDAVGSEVIDRAPHWVKNFAIENFGTNDKLALRIGIITILAIVVRSDSWLNFTDVVCVDAPATGLSRVMKPGLTTSDK